MSKFKYKLDKDGRVVACGYIDGLGDIELKGDEPFSGLDAIDYQYDKTTMKWIYKPTIMIPQQISRLQCVKRLLDTNRYADLMAALNSDQSGVSRILFDAAAVLSRDSNMVNQLATALGFSNEDTDAFFVEAEKINV